MSVSKSSISSWRYQENTSDFGISISSILIPPPMATGQGLCVHNNLCTIAKELGINVVSSKSFYYPRDSKVRTPNGSALNSTSTNQEVQKLASDRCWKRELHLQGNSAATATTHPYFNNIHHGVGILKMLQSAASDELSSTLTNAPTPSTHSRSYWEGGNVIVASNAQGKVKVLIGTDSLSITQQILRKNKFFRPPNSSSPCYVEEVSQNLFQDRINEYYKNGKIPEMVDRLAPQVSEQEIDAVGREMNAMGLIAQFDPNNKEKLTKIVKEYLGQREFVKQVLWPEEFGVAPEDIIEVPQASYHIDVFIKTAPDGGLFVQDFKKVTEFINEIADERLDKASLGEQLPHCLQSVDPQADMHKLDLLKSSKESLTSKDLSILSSYLAENEQLHQDLQPIYERIRTCLSNAGFTIIPTPGALYGKDGDKRVDINFLNALSGWSQQKQSYYYISLGAQVGDNLGMKLMKAYYKFLQSQKTPLHIYYVGFDPKNPHDFSDAMSFSAHKRIQAGVHCLTYELETKEHIDLRSNT